jgi:hypothetical protein
MSNVCNRKLYGIEMIYINTIKENKSTEAATKAQQKYK